MSRNKKIVTWSALVLSIGASVVLTFAATRKSPLVSSIEKKGRAEPTTAATPASVAFSGPVQMVQFTVYDEGIRPTVAHASPGLVSIYLDDKSTHTPSLLIADAQHPIGAITRQIGKLRGHSTVALTPGRYMIYEANRRSNAATLIVAP